MKSHRLGRKRERERQKIRQLKDKWQRKEGAPDLSTFLQELHESRRERCQVASEERTRLPRHFFLAASSFSTAAAVRVHALAESPDPAHTVHVLYSRD